MKSAIRKASIETSHFMGAHVRKAAKDSGWPDHLSRTLNVSYTKGGFSIHAPKHLHGEIGDLEYGTPSQLPTAAMHRAANRTQEAERFFVKRLSQHLGGSHDLPSF